MKKKRESFGFINNIILMGGGQLLVDFLDLLININIKVLVVTSPRQIEEIIEPTEDKTLKENFIEKNIKYLISDDINRNEEIISQINNHTIGLSISGAWIFKRKIIEAFNGRLLNVHGSNLPQNKGGGGHTWRILSDDRAGGVSIHFIDEGIDTGEILMQNLFLYNDRLRIPDEFFSHTRKKAKVLFVKFLKKIVNNENFEIIEQNEFKSSYWPRISSEINAYIDWTWGIKEIEKFICAFDDPYPGAKTYVRKQEVYLKKCSYDLYENSFHPFQKGIIYRKTASNLYVASEEGALLIGEIRNRDGKDYFNKINLGDRFYTPKFYLEKAMSERAVFTPRGLKTHN